MKKTKLSIIAIKEMAIAIIPSDELYFGSFFLGIDVKDIIKI